MGSNDVKNVGNVVNGDGNVFGGGNKVLIDKSTRTVHFGGQEPPGKGDAGFGVALLIGLSIGLACAAYYFAAHAMQVYWGLLAAAVALGAPALYSVWCDLGEGLIWSDAWREVWACVLSASTTLLVIIAMRTYPPELTEHAVTTATMKEFWCGLNSYGHGLAIQHVLGATSVAVSLVFGIPHALASALGRLFGWERGAVQFVARIALKRFVWLSVLLTAIAWWALAYAPASTFSDAVFSGFIGCSKVAGVH